MTIPISELTVVTPEGPVGDAAGTARPSRRRFRFVSNPKAAFGLAVIGVFVLFAIIGPWVAPYDPSGRSRDVLQPPSADHWFGTSHLGQDIFSQILVGTRGVMFVGFLAGLVAMALSVLIGITSGYLGGLLDEGLSALTNVFLVIPALPLIIIISATVQGAGDLMVALVIGFTSWAWGARILRAQTLSLRNRDYVQASRANGETTWRIIVFEILPNLVAIIASSFVSTVIFAVMSEITLAFIGVSNVSTWNWGTILFWAQSQQALAQGAWWWFVPAGAAIALLGTALALLNFGIDEFVSPRLRSSGVGKVRTTDGRKVKMKVGFTPVLMARTSTVPTPVRRAAPATPVTPEPPHAAVPSNPPATSNTPVPSKGTDQ